MRSSPQDSTVTTTTTSRSRRAMLVLVAFALLAAACGKGPNLPATLEKVDVVGSKTSPVTVGVNGADSDGVWQATGTPPTVADAISAVEKPSERSDDASGDIFMLYKTGTLWITASAEGEGSAVVYYADNDKAYNRHTSILILNSRWGTRVNSYRSSSSGNGFRGGGGSSGKN